MIELQLTIVCIELANYVGHELLNLNCNVHPLDSLSLEFRKVVALAEKQSSIVFRLYGSESVMLKLVLNISSCGTK